MKEAWDECKQVFGRDRIVIVSNSAGTPDDVDGKQAAAIERVLGKIYIIDSALDNMTVCNLAVLLQMCQYYGTLKR